MVTNVNLENSSYSSDCNAITATWSGLPENSTGEVFQLSPIGSVCAQISGTFGGATVTLEGSNDAATWFVLTSGTTAAPVSAATAKLFQVIERPRYVRPKVTGGASAAVTVVAFCTN